LARREVPFESGDDVSEWQLMTADLLHKLIPLFALGLNLVLLGSTLSADRSRPSNRVFACVALAVAIWNFGVLGLRSTVDPSEALMWERFLHVGVILSPVLFYHYVLLFLDIPRRRGPLLLGYLLCGAFLLASPTSAFMAGVRTTRWGFAPVAGPIYGVFFVYFQAYLLGGLVSLVRGYRTLQSSFRRNRTLLVIVGAAVNFVGGLVDFSRFMFGWERLYPVGIPTSAVFALALGVALVRYRLINLGVLAKRTVLYLLTAIALVPVLVAGLYAVDHLTPAPGHRVSTETRYLLAILVAVTVALPLLGKLEKLLDRLMFERQHGVRDALVALSKEMSSVLEVQKLGQTLTQGLVARIPVMHAGFCLCEGAAAKGLLFSSASSGAEDTPVRTPPDGSVLSWLGVTRKTLVVEEAAFQTLADPRLRGATARMEAAGIALVVPLLLEGALAGVLIVGEKLSGETFERDEIQLLETLMEETAIALRNSCLYEDLRNQMEELRKTQAQLLQSAKLAALGELAAGVAHEINNPLLAILGTTQLLIRETPAETAALAKLRDVETAARRAAKISRQLLDVGRRREPKRESLAVPDVILRSLELLQPRLMAARVEVQTVFDPELPSIVGDRDELTQVFINLFVNAADSMPAGGALIVRGERAQHDGRRTLTVTVSDTGVGMDGEQLAHIFEPFYTTKPEGEGTGLGLSIARGIIVKQGGTIEAESKRGKGTTMTLNFPLPF